MWKITSSVVFVFLMLASCAQSMLITYSVASEEGTFSVLYEGNNEEIGDTSWSKDLISDGNIFIYVKPLEQNQTLDVRVYYESQNGSGTLHRVVSQSAILIQDKVNVR